MLLKKSFFDHYNQFITLFIFTLGMIALPIIIQALHLLSISESITWMQKFQNQYYVNLYVILTLFCILYTMFNSAFYAFGTVLTGGLIFGIANMEKMKVLHQPVLPSDLLFLRQACLITRYYWYEVSIALICVAAFLCLLYIFRNKINHFRMKLRVRIVVAFLGIGLVFFIVFKYDSIIQKINEHYIISNENWENRDNYSKNGVLYSFMMNLESASVSKPENYNSTEINNIFSPFHDTIDFKKKVTPNVILYVSESFWDITKIKALGINFDPIPTFHSLVKKGDTQELISPTFGGGTCDAEFEIITGMNNRFFPDGAKAYSEYIHRPTPSVVQVFKESGYKTIALHTFKKWFWNRGNVYRYFGFDSFIGLEDLKDPQTKGYYVSDMELAKLIIEQAQVQSQPYFIFGLSMQNHGPYSGKRYDVLDHKVHTSLSEESEMELNNYLQGLKDADESLKSVKSFIDKTRQPTVLIFLGDHLPGFSKLYSEVDCTDESSKDSLFFNRVNAVFYANFPLKKQMQKELSMSYLPLMLTDFAGITRPPFYSYLKNLEAQYPVICKKALKTASGQIVPENEEDKNLTHSYWLAIYDILLGKQYSESYYHIQPALTALP